MTIQDFQFKHEIHIDNVYMVIDKKERQKFSMHGANYSSVGTINGNVIGGGAGYVNGNTDYEYILIAKNMLTDEINELKVNVDTFYKTEINKKIVLNNSYIIHNLRPSLNSNEKANMLLKALYSKLKDVEGQIEYQNQKIKELKKHRFLNSEKIEETKFFIEFLHSAYREIENAISLLEQHINLSLGSSWGRV